MAMTSNGRPMKLKTLALAAALAASGSAFATSSSCTGSFDLGAMGPPATRAIGNWFSGGTARFQDCYDFSINAPAAASGTTTEWEIDWGNLFSEIDLLTVRLFSISSTGTRLSQQGQTDGSPDKFSFSNLAAGAYELVIDGSNSRGSWFASPVGYSGKLTTASAQVAAPVPEPEFYAMLALGLAGAGYVARKRRAAR